MSHSSARDDSPLEHEYHPFAALLSYLVPGLGQIAQGRLLKGVLFFVCVLTLFYYGMYLGSWSNVYVPPDETNPWNLGKPLGYLYNRPQFAAQFFVGVAAWPAIIQSFNYDPTQESGPLFGAYQRVPYELRVRELPSAAPPAEVRPPPAPPGDDPEKRRQARQGVKWKFNEQDNRWEQDAEQMRVSGPLKWNEALTDYHGKTLNELQTDGDKTWDLGWVFTVIAGALNIMVIYDALAGPAFLVVAGSNEESET